MDAKDVISETREAVLRTQAAGISSIDPNKLLELLEMMEEEVVAPAGASDAAAQANLEKYKAELAAWVAQNEHTRKWELESFKLVISLGQDAVKSIVLINGGAAVALLAFIGHLASSPTAGYPIPGFANSLAWFVGGVSLGSLAHGATYLAQHFYDFDGKWLRRTGMAFHALTLAIALTALGCFVAGSNASYREFMKSPSNNSSKPTPLRGAA